MEQTIAYIKRAHKGDKQARDTLVLGNQGLVWSVVQRFLGRGHDKEELFQIGCIGLMKAVDKFDVSYEVCFSTYAVPVIMGEIRRFLRDDGMVKVSRSMKEKGYLISKKGTDRHTWKGAGVKGTGRKNRAFGGRDCPCSGSQWRSRIHLPERLSVRWQ